jgi:hypothetical protein
MLLLFCVCLCAELCCCSVCVEIVMSRNLMLRIALQVFDSADLCNVVQSVSTFSCSIQ